MHLRPAVALAATLAFWAAAAAAQAPDDGRGRFSMSPVEGGFLRLDKETGAVAMCSRKGGEWACDPVIDRSHASGDLAKIEAENQALRDRIKRLEDGSATGPDLKRDTPADPPSGKMQLPTEEEVDKALDYVERIFKKFRDRMQKLEPPANSPAKPGEGGSGAL